MEDYNSSAPVPNNSNEELVRNQSEQTVDVDYHENGLSEVPKEDIREDKVNSGAGFGGASADGRSVYPTGDSQSCSKLDAYKHDSVSTRV